MHVAEQGTGPLVVLLHGFPELWYSWRHQITFFANQYSYSRSMLTSIKNLASLVLSTSTGLWTCKPNLFSQMFSSQEKQNQQSDLSYIYANWKDVNPLFCDRNWELLAAREGTKVTIATKFIVGDKDIGFEPMVRENIFLTLKLLFQTVTISSNKKELKRSPTKSFPLQVFRTLSRIIFLKLIVSPM